MDDGKRAMRYLAIDPGDKHIGLAVSDALGLVARPLTTLTHESRARDVERILAVAAEHAVTGLIVGVPLGPEAEAGPQARKALRLMEALRAATALPVSMHDESFSSQTARTLMMEAGQKRRARRTREHAVAAAAILQSYLDAHSPETPTD
jgi:putative Holliday junction resolvase